MTTFVDTSVLIDALDPAAPRHQWAVDNLAAADQPLVVCDIVYSELSVSMSSVADTNAAVQQLSLERCNFTDGALFAAGKAYEAYKKRGGTKTSLLSDFFIGAVAHDEGAPLMTANARDFKKCFPGVILISPPEAS